MRGDTKHFPPSVQTNVYSLDYSDFIPQFDGNMSLPSQSEMSSLLTETQCDCCDDQPECMITSSSESDYDQDYADTPRMVPVLVPQYVCAGNSDPPPWYEEYMPRLVDKK